MSIWPTAYAQHEAAILAFLRRRLGPEDAQDLCQETFARAVAAGDALRDPAKVRSYLFRIAHNLMVNRARRPTLVRSESDLGEEVSLERMARAPERWSPQAAAGERMLRERVAAVLETLSPEQRTAFELGVLDRCPYREIAARTGWSISKVKINVFRARRKMIAALGDQRPGRRGDDA